MDRKLLFGSVECEQLTPSQPGNQHLGCAPWYSGRNIERNAARYCRALATWLRRTDLQTSSAPESSNRTGLSEW